MTDIFTKTMNFVGTFNIFSIVLPELSPGASPIGSSMNR